MPNLEVLKVSISKFEALTTPLSNIVKMLEQLMPSLEQIRGAMEEAEGVAATVKEAAQGVLKELGKEEFKDPNQKQRGQIFKDTVAYIEATAKGVIQLPDRFKETIEDKIVKAVKGLGRESSNYEVQITMLKGYPDILEK
jgi:hypothetical protein